MDTAFENPSAVVADAGSKRFLQKATVLAWLLGALDVGLCIVIATADGAFKTFAFALAGGIFVPAAIWLTLSSVIGATPRPTRSRRAPKN